MGAIPVPSFGDVLRRYRLGERVYAAHLERTWSAPSQRYPRASQRQRRAPPHDGAQRP